LSVENLNGEIIFLRKLTEGPTNESYGIHVAKMAGVPDEVVERAYEILKSLGNFSLKPAKTLPETNAYIDKDISININKNKNIDVINRIKDLDLNNATPLESLKILFELKSKIND
jgi:DNA mismatch repair protein MutS